MVYILLGNGFEEIEVVTPLDLLRRAGIEVQTVGINGKTVCGSHNIRMETDITLDQLDRDAMEMVMIPGGLQGVAAIRASKAALDTLLWAWENDRFVTAICGAPTVLADLGITDGKNATCYPGCESGMGKAKMVENAAVVRDGKLITGASLGCAIPFGLKLIAALRSTEAAENIEKQIVIR